MQQVCAALAEHCQLDNKLFVSIAAGIEVNRLQQMLKANHKIIRTMPNTPSALGRGMTGLFAKDDVSRCDRNFAGDLMQQIGEIAWVQNEPMMNVVIAAAGSSPAYFFLFLEAMQKQAEAMGLDHNTARLLIQQSMLGAAEMVCHNPHLELSELRTQVTSKGGTTAQAIASFQGQGLDSIVANAMQAAITRAEHMAQQI
jgi:pyrroline-5-carboxylate reductase